MILPLRRKTKKTNGFTIVEVVVAALIFAIAAAGIITMTSRIRPQAAVSEREVGAALYAKHLLGWLRAKVDARTWDNGVLKTGTYTNWMEVGGINYSATYVITNDTLSGGRVVDMNIVWDEPG